jgi:DNA-directed RNA polymerase subunit H (RpoH/RPB5)
MKRKYDIRKHMLVPEHVKLTDKEKKGLLENYHISLKELPKISKKDPAIQHLNAKEGDVIKIIRKSQTASEAIFYRGVINV